MHRQAPRSARRVPAALLAALVAGGALRLLVLRSNWQQLDSDQATGLLMAQRASQGHLSLLFWGGNYGGDIVTWLEAPFVRIFGLHIVIFQIADTSQAFVAVLLLWRIGRYFLSETAAEVAAGMLWFFPATWVFWSSREYVFWLPAVVFALAANLLTLRWVRSRSRATLLGFGLCLGLSVWSYPLAVSLLVPASCAVVWSLRHDRSELLRPVGGALAGVGPWLGYFVVHGRSALHRQTAPGSTYVALRHSVTEVLPTALVGGQKRFDVIWAGPDASQGHLIAIGAATFAGVCAVLVVSAVTRRTEIAACAASLVLWPVVLVAGHVPITTATFRYGFVALPPLLLLLAWLASLLRLAHLVGVATLVASIHTVWSDTDHLARVSSCNPSVDVADTALLAAHRTDVWASYWLAGPIEVCSRGSVVAGATSTRRDASAASRAEGAAQSTYVVFSGNSLDQQIGLWVAAHHTAARRVAVGGYIAWEFDTRVEPETMQLNGAF